MSQRPGQPRTSQQKLAEMRRQQRPRETWLRALAGAAALTAVALVALAVIAFTAGRSRRSRTFTFPGRP